MEPHFLEVLILRDLASPSAPSPARWVQGAFEACGRPVTHSAELRDP